MAEQDADRSEQATEHKLDEARNKGNVAKSVDFISMGVLAGLAVWIYGNGWESLRLSFIPDRPAEELGFALERQERGGRQIASRRAAIRR